MSTKTHSFVALYMGDSIATTQLLAASTDFTFVCQFAQHLLRSKEKGTPLSLPIKAVQEGVEKALAIILEGRDKQ